MPLEIRELVIQANLKAGESDGNQTPSASTDDRANSNEMIQACVEAVLEIINKNNDR